VAVLEHVAVAAAMIVAVRTVGVTAAHGEDACVGTAIA